MEEVFIEHLDQLYWQGYAEQLRDSDPNAFQRQLSEFMENHKMQGYEVRNHLSDGTGCGAVRTPRHKRNRKRGGNIGNLFGE